MEKGKKIKKWLPLLCATLLLLGSCMTVCASTVYHLPSDISDKANSVFGSADFNYIIYKYDNVYYIDVIPLSGCYFNTTSYSTHISSNTDKYLTASSSDGSTWTELQGWSGSGGFRFVGGDRHQNVDIIVSSDDIYSISGGGMSYHTNEWIKENSTGIFFQRPPIPIAEMAIPLAGAVQKQTGIILPIAVGCLALVIGSIVLLPRLRNFLAR